MATAPAGKEAASVRALLERAKSAEERGHHATALELLGRALARDPGRGSITFRIARNLLDIGRISEAEALFKQAQNGLECKPWFVEMSLGELRMAQFRPAEAEDHFRRAWHLHATSTVCAVFLADCLIKQEKLAEADRVLTAALSADGDRDEVYLNLGAVRMAQGRYREARVCFLEALAITPRYPEARRGLTDVEQLLNLQAPAPRGRT